MGGQAREEEGSSSAGKIKRTLEIVGSFQNYTSFWGSIWKYRYEFI